MNRHLSATSSGLARMLHLKLRFGLSKLPFFPARYRLRTAGQADSFFYWTRVIPFMNPNAGAFDYELWGWDVRELRFLRRFLSPGMSFIDIGAHHGLYATLAAKLVGNSGHVLAFEPSPRVFRRLRVHLALNRARCVEALNLAVGDQIALAQFYVPCRGIDTPKSSLRPAHPGVPGRTRRIQVQVTTLDHMRKQRRLSAIDLVKLDVEGGEAAVLAGARQTIECSRPCWLFEAQDPEAAVWGRTARMLVDQFIALRHELYELSSQGFLRPHEPCLTYPARSDCNLLAVPCEKHAIIVPLLLPLVSAQ